MALRICRDIQNSPFKVEVQMNFSRWLALCSILCLGLSPIANRFPILAADALLAAKTSIRRSVEPLDGEMLKQHSNFGYSPEEIEKYFAAPRVLEFYDAGLARDRIQAPPAPGIHPRVLFGPDGLPALRKRLTAIKPAKMQMDGIRAMLQRARGNLFDLSTTGKGPRVGFGAFATNRLHDRSTRTGDEFRGFR